MVIRMVIRIISDMHGNSQSKDHTPGKVILWQLRRARRSFGELGSGQVSCSRNQELSAADANGSSPEWEETQTLEEIHLAFNCSPLLINHMARGICKWWESRWLQGS